MTKAQHTMQPPVAAEIVAREAVLRRGEAAPLHFGRVTRRASRDEIFRLCPAGEPIALVLTMPEQTQSNLMWRNGRLVRRPPLRRNSFQIVDHREDWAVQVPNPIDSFHVWLPRQALRELNGPSGRGVDELTIDLSQDCRDEVMVHLALALLPSLKAPAEVDGLFRDHVFEAMLLHVARTYGGYEDVHPWRYGGLTHAQMKQVRERLLDDLSADHDLKTLAQSCGLSVSHFARAFKASSGDPPHRWLLRQRVRQAQQLLARTERSISGIAQACGFVDQSHLTRVFSRMVGTSPAKWRRSLHA